jgi:hypothetical protein
MSTPNEAKLLARIERLQAFIALLQAALGWQIEVETKHYGKEDRKVALKFSLTFDGNAWPSIVRDNHTRHLVLEMVKNRLFELWSQERTHFTGPNRLT